MSCTAGGMQADRVAYAAGLHDRALTTVDKLNPDSQWRLDLARSVAPEYLSQPGVAAVAVCGSVARGWADRHSDIELTVWWHRAPTPAERAACVHRVAGLSQRRGHLTNPDVEDFAVCGVKFDVAHPTVDGQDHIVSCVVDGHDTSEVSQVAVADVMSAIPIHGGELLGRWRRRADPYPEGLARAMVEANLKFGPNAWVERLTERDDLLPLAEISVTAVKQVFGVLLGLNRIYHPGNKWMDRTLASMKVCPLEIPIRMRAVLASPARARVAELKRLIEHTIRLVEQELPDVDTAPVRARVHSAARVWDRPSPRSHA